MCAQRAARPCADATRRPILAAVKRILRKYLPEPEEVLAKKWAAPFRPWLGHPNLWHLNRRSVPGAVAIGLFCGLIPGPVQMLSALLVAIPCRSNVPLAMVVTWYTNPFTIVPLYLAAYEVGRLVLGADRAGPVTTIPDWHWSIAALWEWLVSLGKPLAVGLVALALILAIVGYWTTRVAWRLYVVTAWSRRSTRRKASP
jgi:uncharacterized protein (DUF2062 family)